MVRSTCAALIAFVLFVILHFLHFHFFIPADKAASVLGMALFGGVLYLIALKLLPAEEKLRRTLRLDGPKALVIFPALVGGLVYALLFMGHLEFYFTADRSITFRMLRIIDEQPDHSLASAQMLEIYDTKAIILRRFEDLEYGGYLQRQGEKYSLTPKAERTLWLYRFTIDFLRLVS